MAKKERGTFATKLPKELIERLRRQTEVTGVSQRHFVEKAIEKALREIKA